MEHQLAAVQESEPLKRHLPIAGQPPVFDRPSAQQTFGNMALQRRAQDVPDVLHSSSRPLEASTRSFMEPRFGRDLSHVRVHTDEHAGEGANAVQARAYTVGQDIAFAPGQYSPGTKEGERLIAHEVAHTIQQGEAPHSSSNELNVSSPHDASERQADSAAAAISSGGTASVQPGGAPLQIARQAQGEDHKPGLLERAKTAVYESLVSSLRGPQQRLISEARREARRQPEEVRARIESIIDDFELITDIFIGLIEAIVAVVGGIISGLVGLIVGLFHIVTGILHGLYLVAQGVVTGDFHPLLHWLDDLWQTIKNIPGALKALVTSWLEEFKHASTDRQTIMIGELTGQIIALLLPAAATGGAAVGGTSAELGGGGGELGAFMQGASRVTSTGTRLVSVSTKAEQAAELTSAAARAPASFAALPTEGALALKSPLQVAAEEALTKAPAVAPKVAPVVAPVVAPAAAPAAGTAEVTSKLGTITKVATGLGVATHAIEEGQKQQKKKQCGDPDLPWTHASWTGADRGESMKAEPLTRCGPQGSDPTIDLPGWRCIQNAPKPPDGKRETDFWVHAHLLHGRYYGPDLHGPGNDPRNLIITDKSINIKMYLDVEQHAIANAHYLDQTLSYEVKPRHMANSGDKRYFADAMHITLKQIDPITRQVLQILWDRPITSSKQRTPPGNCV